MRGNVASINLMGIVYAGTDVTHQLQPRIMICEKCRCSFNPTGLIGLLAYLVWLDFYVSVSTILFMFADELDMTVLRVVVYKMKSRGQDGSLRNSKKKY